MYIELSSKVVCLCVLHKKDKEKNIYIWKTRSLLLLAKSFQPSCPETLKRCLASRRDWKKSQGWSQTSLICCSPVEFSRKLGIWPSMYSRVVVTQWVKFFGKVMQNLGEIYFDDIYNSEFLSNAKWAWKLRSVKVKVYTLIIVCTLGIKKNLKIG